MPRLVVNPDLGRSINFDAFRPLIRSSKEAGVRRFIYASSSSVYGVKDQPDVTADPKTGEQYVPKDWLLGRIARWHRGKTTPIALR